MVLGKLPVPGLPTILITVGQGPIALAVDAGGGDMDILLSSVLSLLSPSLWETARYRLKYCLKGPLNPKQPTNQPTIIPIPKPGKDNTNPNNYRPIALTSCICRTLERMINERLVWYLETNNIITEFQSGFRHQRSTNDHLVRLETFIREAFIKKEHLVAVFFDLEKAYDTTWKYGIIIDLHEIGLKGRLPIFV